MKISVKQRRIIVIDFIRFLKSHSAYEYYLENAKIKKCNVLKEIMKRKAILNLIATAFAWDETPQGTHYWIKIDDKWVGYVKWKYHYIFDED